MGFLLVGHTHDQIDQMLSKFSSCLNKEDAYTLDSLIKLIEESYKPKAFYCPPQRVLIFGHIHSSLQLY